MRAALLVHLPVAAGVRKDAGTPDGGRRMTFVHFDASMSQNPLDLLPIDPDPEPDPDDYDEDDDEDEEDDEDEDDDDDGEKWYVRPGRLECTQSQAGA